MDKRGVAKHSPSRAVRKVMMIVVLFHEQYPTFLNASMSMKAPIPSLSTSPTLKSTTAVDMTCLTQNMKPKNSKNFPRYGNTFFCCNRSIAAQVRMMEDEEGNTQLRNISSLPAASIEDALNLLFVGDTNRMICETPMNDASSRSHCIFMISMESREVFRSGQYV